MAAGLLELVGGGVCVCSAQSWIVFFSMGYSPAGMLFYLEYTSGDGSLNVLSPGLRGTDAWSIKTVTYLCSSKSDNGFETRTVLKVSAIYLHCFLSCKLLREKDVAELPLCLQGSCCLISSLWSYHSLYAAHILFESLTLMRFGGLQCLLLPTSELLVSSSISN